MDSSERIRDHMINGLLEEAQILEHRITILERKLMAHHEIREAQKAYPQSRIGDPCVVCVLPVPTPDEQGVLHGPPGQHLTGTPSV